MAKVYAWPPVGAVGTEWTEDAPVNASRSIITGRDYASAHARKRRLASVTASSLGRGASGAGYMEMLKRFVAGGVGLVRLNSYPINWHLDAAAAASWRQSHRVSWSQSGDDVSWRDGADLVTWFSGAVLTGAAGTSGGWPILTVTGLPPSRLVARPGEFVTLFASTADMTGATAQIVTEARSDADGVAVLRLFSALTGSGRVNIGTSDTGVFKATTIPRSVQPVGGDWTYAWQFREVFADEVGGFTEVNPW